MKSNSEKLFEEAFALMPGGVNSPVRAFGAVGGTPPFIAKALGAKIWDVDGKEYIDYVGSWGPAILGHADPKVVAAVQSAATRGFSFGAPTELESRLAGMVHQIFPSMEKLRFVNSGTEATMSAIRLARGATGRDKIIKFEGCYHGHADFLLVEAGSGAATFGVPSSSGVPHDFAKHTLVAPYNDLNAVENLFQKNKKEIACVIVEPVAGNMGCVPPQPGFLNGLQKLCQGNGALLVFDEVMTGFRVALGGAQERYNIKPDITCLGKILGGGLPVGAYGGRKDLMDQIAPLGKIYQAGTLSGNPLAMTAGVATLAQLVQNGVYQRLQTTTDTLIQGIKKILQSKRISYQIQSVGSMWTLFFAKEPVIDFKMAKKSNLETFKHFFHEALNKGIYLPPSQFEACFVGLAHKKEEIDQTLSVFEVIL
ncbi:MAG: glutamate-1-semialdehyde-2,1-aminomutase [Deltaproteobacteria bacterium RIFCSPLOWO2_02_FULL_46_8]|nr:MAG: glutamate-1-semialdehyde-2,1-aminomutase [Deltaproteobacteria bacterium RIFCSPLOWO2_02_FULL_46_8]